MNLVTIRPKQETYDWLRTRSTPCTPPWVSWWGCSCQSQTGHTGHRVLARTQPSSSLQSCKASSGTSCFFLIQRNRDRNKGWKRIGFALTSCRDDWWLVLYIICTLRIYLHINLLRGWAVAISAAVHVICTHVFCIINEDWMTADKCSRQVIGWLTLCTSYTWLLYNEGGKWHKWVNDNCVSIGYKQSIHHYKFTTEEFNSCK